MNTPMNSTDHSFASMWLSSTFLADLIVLDSPDEMARHLCEQLRELTGAKTVAFSQHTESHAHCKPLYVCPPRRAELFEGGKLSNLCPACHPDPIPANLMQLPPDAPLREQLVQAGFQNLIRIPIECGGDLIGSILIADLPDPENADEVRTMMEFLGPTIGLAIQNCQARQQIQDQRDSLEEQVEVRTAELEAANRELNASRGAALNMMEDALLSKEKLELSQFSLDHAADAIFWINPDASFFYVNEAACQRLGYTKAELLNLSVHDIDPEFPAEKWEGFWPDLMQQKAMRFESTHQTKTGEIFPVEIISNIIQFHEKEYANVYAHDITERKQAAEALQASETHLSTLINTIPDLVWLKNPAGVYLSCNSMFENLYGAKEEAIVGKTDYDFVSKEVADCFRDHDRKAMEAGETSMNEEHLTFAGTGYECEFETLKTPMYDSEGKLLGVLGVARDITERRQAEEMLAKTEAKQAKMVANIGDVIVIIDPDGINRYKSPNINKWFGWKPEEVVGSGAMDLVHPDDVDRAQELIDDLMSEPNRTGTIECRYRCEDGTYKWIEFTGINLLHDSDIQGILGNYHDITERKQIEQIQTFLAKTSGGISEEPFFHALARFLAENLTMDFVCIDRLEGDGLIARTEAVWNGGKFEDNVTYALKDTPCGDVVGKQVCCFPDQVCQLFPNDPVLKDLRAESYVGVTLFDHTGQPIGLIAVISQKPLANRALAEATLKMVAVRAAGELERLQAESTLRQSEEQYRELAENTDAILWEYDITADRWTYVAPQAERILGYASDEWTNQEFWTSHLHEEDREWAVSYCDSFTARGEAHDFEYRFRKKNGEFIWLRDVVDVKMKDGVPVALRGVMFDITQLKTALSEMTESEKKFKAIYDNAPLSYQSLDEEGCFLDVNPTWLKTLGFEKEEVIGKRYADFLHPDWKPHFEKNFPAFKKRGYVSDVQFRIRHKDGHYLDIEFEGCVGRYPDGSFKQTYCVFQDITDRKQAEEALRVKMEELQRWQTATLGREGRVAELKTEVNELAARLGESPLYGTLESPECKETP